MASSKAPNVLQAIGEAAAAAMPGARADKKERKELKDRALDGLLKLGAQDRAQAKEILSLGTDIYQTGLKQEQFEQELGVKQDELLLARDKLNAEIAAAKNTGMNVSSMVFSMFNSGNPAMKAAAEEWIMLNNPPSGSEVDYTQRLKDIREGRGGSGGSGGSATPAAPKGFVVD